MNLKKILAGALAGVMAVASATVVSAVDVVDVDEFNTELTVTNFFNEKTDAVELKDGGSYTFTFHNKSNSNESNYENFVLAVTGAIGEAYTGADEEVLIIRSDIAAWGGGLSAYDDDLIFESNIDWGVEFATWRAFAYAGFDVVIDLERDGDTLVYKAVFSDDDVEYFANLTATSSKALPESLYVFLTGENCVLTNIAVTGGNPAEDTEEEEEVDTSAWNVAFVGFDSGWGGWKGVSSEAGVLEFEATIGDVAEALGIESLSSFGGFALQVWNVNVGDTVDYEITVVTEDGKEVLTDSDTHTFGYKIDDKTGEETEEVNMQINQYVAKNGFDYGTYTFAETDIITAKISLPGEEGGNEGEEDKTPASKIETTTEDLGNIEVDGSAEWNSAGSGKTFPVTVGGVTVTFENEPFLRGDDNWFNFVFEFLPSASQTTVDGLTLRADAFGWNFNVEASRTDDPTYTVVKSWGDDWDAFHAAAPGTVKLTVKQTGTKTVEASILFENGATEVYTVTYANGVPEDLEFQIGSDGGKVTLVSAEYVTEYVEKEVEGDSITITVTEEDDYWKAVDIDLDTLIGDIDPEDIISITFTCDGIFNIAYNKTRRDWGFSSENGYAAGSSVTVDDIAFNDYSLTAVVNDAPGEYVYSWTINAWAEKTAEDLVDDDDNNGGDNNGGDNNNNSGNGGSNNNGGSTSTPSAGDDNKPDDGKPDDVTPPPASGDGNNGGAAGGNNNDNPSTGAIIVLIPAAIAAAGVLISKKRK